MCQKNSLHKLNILVVKYYSITYRQLNLEIHVEAVQNDTASPAKPCVKGCTVLYLGLSSKMLLVDGTAQLFCEKHILFPYSSRSDKSLQECFQIFGRSYAVRNLESPMSAEVSGPSRQYWVCSAVGSSWRGTNYWFQRVRQEHGKAWWTILMQWLLRFLTFF